VSAVSVPVRAMPGPALSHGFPEPGDSSTSVFSSDDDFHSIDQSSETIAGTDDLVAFSNDKSVPVSQSTVRFTEIFDKNEQSTALPALCDFPADRVSTSQSDLTLDVKNVKSVASSSRSRRPVSQRWFYESGSKDVAPLTPSLPKRKSNPPQRLTASRLGLMAISSSDSSSRE
jgi:hypothetical protein